METLEKFLVSADNYISANSLTLTFLAVCLGLAAFIIILLFLLKTSRTISRQNKTLIEQFESGHSNNKIDRSLGIIRDYNSHDFGTNVLSILENKLRMLGNNEITIQDMENDEKFLSALSSVSMFFNSTGYLYMNDQIDKTLIFTNLAESSKWWFENLTTHNMLINSENSYWALLNNEFANPDVLKLEEEVNPIKEKALF